MSVGEQVETAYRYGLELYDPSATECDVYVRRDEADLMFPVVPRLLPGGKESRLVAVPERQERFFR